MIEIKCLSVGFLQTNCYTITDKTSGDIAIVDPGDFSKNLEEIVNSSCDKIKYILLTHGHFDHIGYVSYIKSKTNAKVVIGKEEELFLSENSLNLSPPIKPIQNISADVTLSDDDTIMLGETTIKFIHTPGHTSGSGCYVVNDNIFTGDTLMKLSMGRTDLPTGNNKAMMCSLKKLSQLEGEFNVFPGHGDASLLSYEKNFNPYVRAVI